MNIQFELYHNGNKFLLYVLISDFLLAEESPSKFGFNSVEFLLFCSIFVWYSLFEIDSAPFLRSCDTEVSLLFISNVYESHKFSSSAGS